MNDEDSVTPFMPQSRILAEQYEPMMSDYLRCEKTREEWKINWIEWDAPTIRASARLEGWSGSKTDRGRFHLSIYSAREMDAQLFIISLHLRLGLSRKTAEVWHLKCTEECRSPITDPDDVRFERVSKLRKTSKGKVLTEDYCRISDCRGGEIVLSLMGLMEWRDEWGVIPNQF